MTKNRSTNLSIRMDLDLKRDAEELFGSLGMNLTTAFNIFIRQSLQVQGLPFPVKLKLHADAGIDKSPPKTEEPSEEASSNQ